MPIKQRLAKVAAKASTSTHDGNEEKLKIEEQAEDGVTNHMTAERLTDPEDLTSGSTHSMAKIKASLQQNVGTIDNDVDPAAGVLENAATEEQNVGMLDHDEDPAEGYLENADTTTVNEDEMSGGPSGEDQVEATFEVEGEEDLENNNEHTPLEADADEDEWENADEDDTMSDIADDEASEPEVEEEQIEVEDMPAKGEELALLDVDEVPDDDTSAVAFASFGTRLMVIRANRIIATMTKKMAASTGRADVYLSDQFQEVTASELEKKGLRKGLKAMGFALAKVNVSKDSAINARVQLAVSKTTAAVRKVTATKEAAFQQSLTIAAVGINRRYFADQQNELKAHLETELQRAGVRGGNKIVQHAFAQFGPAYAKTIVELATKIAAMPQDSRDGFVTALDLTSEDMDVPEEEVVPVGVEGPGMDNNAEDIGDEFEDDTVTASLASPGYRIQTKASVMPAGSVSLAASAILSGERPLFG